MLAAWRHSRKPPLEHFSSEILAIMIGMGDKPAGFRMRKSDLEVDR
ncbi:hypothetical protein RB2654_02749 [Maritimibacter alkaliphilus HTCC2654]|uniref:Uncharacterized protein n=1 Tax=Maritimibacter alkaliphilus HTCC2654 TaxID=314271 RepID=A3VDK8_9RHOB|nr:hypothetical protein RB2654_02749 [Maritimibacter alkaliphilus HTCC2654]